MENEPVIIGDDWKLLMSFFPADWEHLAHSSGALKGLRKSKSAEDFLRTILIHVGSGCSLRETVVRARKAKLAELSDVALLKRLRKSVGWLHVLCVSLLGQRLQPPVNDSCAPVMHLIDGTIISEPGQTGSQWRVHYSLSWPSLQCDYFKLAPVEGKGNGENLTHFPIQVGSFYLADRGYSSASGIRHVTQGGGYLAVRLNPQAVRLLTPQGEEFDLGTKLQKISQSGQVESWPVTVADSVGEHAATGRLCAIRKSPEAIAQSQRKLRAKARKSKTTLRSETLLYAQFVMVFTTFPEKNFPPPAVLEWYRLRWQIELVFKRFKQIAELGHLPKHDEESARAWLYGKLFVTLLAEKIRAHAESFSPWGYDFQKIARGQSLAGVPISVSSGRKGD